MSVLFFVFTENKHEKRGEKFPSFPFMDFFAIKDQAINRISEKKRNENVISFGYLSFHA